jgi:type II secretory pathway component GspD/PulD (secretin)
MIIFLMTSALNKRRTLFLFCSILFLMTALSGMCRAETIKIPINYREASELLPLVKTMLSPKGEAVADKLTNSIIITDNAESIKKISTFLPKVDMPGRQVRIRLKFLEVRSSEDRSLSAGGSVSDKGWEVSKSKKKQKGLTIGVVGESTFKRQSSESFITVTSGSSAYIMAGKDIPYRERWLYLSRRYAKLVDTVVFRRVETGMEVRPVVTGKVVHIDITPRISYESSEGKKGTIRFTSAQTRLSVPLGKWVSMGGTSGKENEVLNAILECGRGDRDSSLAILMLVEAN